MPYMDGYDPALIISVNDIINIGQGGTTGHPGTSTTKQATLAQILGGAPGSQYLPLIGGTVTGLTIFTAGLRLTNLPTSDAGLVTGDVWNNGTFLCVAS